MKAIAIIPSRYGSSRFPGKPLADICGKPLLWWVYRQVSNLGVFDEVVCAIDYERIREMCEEHNMKYSLVKEVCII